MQPAVRTAIFVIACVGSVAVPRTTHTQSAACLVSTLNGPVQGVHSGDSCVFAGIPYAAPPVGELRWKPPQPAPAWTFLNANNTQSNCPSIRLPERVLTGTEDCLRLNIWMTDPLPAVPAPVIVWLHTGAFFGGSANLAFHNPQRLVLETGAIVVMPNYRHGPFGFLAHSALTAEDPLHPASGNYGLMDQRAALEWVRDNIARFGGDPQNVTLAGTSAGGESVGLHLVSPASGGLFHRAIVQSAAVTVRWPDRAEAESQGAALAGALGCTGSDVLSCMRSKSRNDVMLALSQGTQQVAARPGTVYWTPIVDGLEIPDQPRYLLESGSLTPVPTIVGTNRDEAWGAFVTRSFPSAGPDPVQYEAWVLEEFGPDAPGMLATYPPPGGPSAAEQMARLAGDVQFVCEARRLARFIERTRTPVYVYSYEYEIDALVTDHVIHGLESNILFGNDYLTPAFPATHPLDASDFALHSVMAGYWTRFAKTGNPNSDDENIVHWPAFKHPTAAGRGSDKYLVLDVNVREGMRQRERECDFLEPFFFRSILAGVPASIQ